MREAGSGKRLPVADHRHWTKQAQLHRHPPVTVETHLDALEGVIPTLFPTARFHHRPQLGEEDGTAVRKKGSKTCSFHSYSQDRLACAFGALTFAGLAFGAALYPLI